MGELNYAYVKPGDLITVRHPRGTTITGVMESFDRNDSIEGIPFVIATAGILHDGFILVDLRPGPPAWDREGVDFTLDSNGDIWARDGDGGWEYLLGPSLVRDSRSVEDAYGPCRALIPEDVA